MTDCGASSESARQRTGSDVFKREGCALLAACKLVVPAAMRALVWLSVLTGLTMSSSGDLMWISLPSSSLGGFTCASSSICKRVSARSGGTAPAACTSVPLVPLLSTGEGSTVEGYGLGGGCRWSAFEDLAVSVSAAPSMHHCTVHCG